MEKSAEQDARSADPDIIEDRINIGQVEQVVSSADCRSADQTETHTTRVSEEKSGGGAAGESSPDGELAEPPRRGWKVPRRRFSDEVPCAICGAAFVRTNSRSRYCSAPCSAEGERQKNADYRRANPPKRPETREQRLAWKAVYSAVRSGALTKPDRCQSCGSAAELHGHHHRGYTGPARFVVRWLCPTCHKGEHRRLAEAA